MLNKFLTVGLLLLIPLTGCSPEDSNFIHWADKTESQIKRLENSNIKYELRNNEIWIKEKDLDKAVSCCS